MYTLGDVLKQRDREASILEERRRILKRLIWNSILAAIAILFLLLWAEWPLSTLMSWSILLFDGVITALFFLVHLERVHQELNRPLLKSIVELGTHTFFWQGRRVEIEKIKRDAKGPSLLDTRQSLYHPIVSFTGRTSLRKYTRHMRSKLCASNTNFSRRR